MLLALAQMNSTVGDLAGNAAKIADFASRAHQAGAALVVSPELSLCGYPPEDLVLRPGFLAACENALHELAQKLPPLPVVVGYPEAELGRRYNAAAVLAQGRVMARYRKQRLPNYTVFDEMRHFQPGNAPCVFHAGGVAIGLLICEDVWYPEPAAAAVAAGAELLLAINASPYHTAQHAARRKVLDARVSETGKALVYLNLVGGQDELVFDGASVALRSDCSLAQQLPAFRETLALVEIEEGEPKMVRGELALPREAMVYEALCLGVRDYVGKNGFPGVLLGLSGGIDSALTLAIAVDALGADKVRAVMLPSPYTRQISIDDSREMVKILGVRYREFPIDPVFQSFLATLRDEFSGLPEDAAEENIQARIRGTLMMALSNKFGAIVLTTGNKSEMAVGYATLYGDMAGGFAVLKDIAKTLVYRLAHYRNSLGSVIPERIITRAPSAELRPDQTDQDSLPPYEVLDGILQAYVEEDRSPQEIVAAGYAPADVRKVVRLIKLNEYKRRQAAVGIRITSRSFGRDWRYPITSRYRDWDDLPAG